MAPNKLSIWWQAVRPKTLWAAIAPVLMGTGMAFGDGIHHWKSAAVALFAALMIQIATNLVNDYCDYQRGVDTDKRSGPLRVTQAGLVSSAEMLAVICVVFIMATLASAYLIWRGGFPIMIIALSSLICAVVYTAGPFPLGANGLGELFVLIFFGPIAVGGTYYVQALEINPAIITAGFAPGLFSVAILTVNNLRDIVTDKEAGKRTLAVRMGPSLTRYQYVFSILGACLIPVLVHGMTRDYRYSLLSTACLFFAVPLIKTVLETDDGSRLNRALADTGKLLMLFSVIFIAGWIA